MSIETATETAIQASPEVAIDAAAEAAIDWVIEARVQTGTGACGQAEACRPIEASSKILSLGGRRHGRSPALIPWLLSALLGVCLLVIGGCRASEPTVNSDLLATTAPAGRLQEVSPPPAVQQLAAALAERSPQLQIEAPTADSLVVGGSWQLRLRLRDWPLVDAGPLGIGPHLVVQIDDEPPLRISDHRPSFQGDQLLVSLPALAPGSHRITAYAALPWGEAVKDPGATARLRLHAVAANPLSLPAPGSPELIPVSPAELGGSEPLLLDWLLYDAPLQHLRQGDDSWRLRVSINGDSFLVDQNAPLWLRGWHQGSNALQLELVDGRGEPLNPPYNSLVRQVNLAGGPPPRWLGAPLSSQELAVYLGQIPPETLAPAKRPAAPKNGSTGAGEPLAKPGAAADLNDLLGEAAKAGLAEPAKLEPAQLEPAKADADAMLADPLGVEVDLPGFFDANANANANANQAESITVNAIPLGESAPPLSRPESSQARHHQQADVNTAGNDSADAGADAGAGADADADADVDADAEADIYAGMNANADVDADADLDTYAGMNVGAQAGAATDADVVNPAQVNAGPVAAAVAKPAIDQPQPQPQPQPQRSEPLQSQPALAGPVSGQASSPQIDPAVAEPELSQPTLSEPEFSQPAVSEPALTKSALADRLIGRLIGRDRAAAQEQLQGDADQAASDPAPGGGSPGALRRRLAG